MAKEQIRCSIVLATRNKAQYLEHSLSSIYCQQVPFPYEVIVIDDGSTDNTREVCKKYGVQYHFLWNPRYRNPSVARNIGYRMAKGTVVIQTCDDVIQVSLNTIEHLTQELQPGEFLLAQVQNYHYVNGKPEKFILDYCGPRMQKPYFFLGSLWRSDLYAVGGYEEAFVEPCYDDNWFADCLMKGLELRPKYTDEVQGHHQDHGYARNSHKNEMLSKELYQRKRVIAKKSGIYVASGAPWKDYSNYSVENSSKKSKVKEIKAKKVVLAPTNRKIPKRMNFFWGGSRLSWMRYMTLYSFRKYHPDWEINLFIQNTAYGPKLWRSLEIQDCDQYEGPNYLSRVEDLGIEMVPWKSSAINIPNLAPAHASDLFEWETLSRGNCFYADMDILFVQPLPYESICHSDVVCCLTLGYMAIGFFGASVNNDFFGDTFKSAREGYAASVYQSTGTEAIYRLAGVWPNWGTTKNPGDVALKRLREQYFDLSIVELASEIIYPWMYKQPPQIFEQLHSVPENTVGIHWFGGSPIAQHWNNLLIHTSYLNYESTFTRYARKVLEDD